MKSSIIRTIERIGTDITVQRDNMTDRGKAVIYPVRYTSKSGGGTGSAEEGRNDPHKYYIYAKSELLGGAVRGDTVSDGKNEYYILWTDDYESKYGSYTKACARKAEGR